MSTPILIVDDHDAVRGSLHKWLGTLFPQCHVVEAASGEEAVAIAQAVLPRVVIMDIGLPQMNGIEATRNIKAAVPTAQVVMFTIHEGDKYRDDAVAAGASAYVLKGAMSTELPSTLAMLLSVSDESEGEEI